VSVQALILKGRALLPSCPEEARAAFQHAISLSPADQKARDFLERARVEIRRSRRAAMWFDGTGTEARSTQANSEHLCFQCTRYLPGGRVAEQSSKWHGQYFCSECWETWTKIRVYQQQDLDKRVDKAIHSDYSTHTDELPSLDDVPKDWDAAHPMWHRRGTEVDWQLKFLDKKTRDRVLRTNSRRVVAAERQAQFTCPT